MKRRQPEPGGTAHSDYPPGMSGTPNRFEYRKIRDYFRITRSTNIYICEGRKSVTHSWWCEWVHSLGTVTTGPYKSWREAFDNADREIRRAKAARRAKTEVAA